MKKTLLAIIFACCTLTLSAQLTVNVKYQGARPTISDFAWSLLSYEPNDDEDGIGEALMAMSKAMRNKRNGLKQEPGVTLKIDERNGFISFEHRYQKELLKIEMCYWNEADGKHKLFACNVRSYDDGKISMGQCDGLFFYRYDNATKKMKQIYDVGFEIEYEVDGGSAFEYVLPQVGKDIKVKEWLDGVLKKQRTAKWNGRGFNSPWEWR